MTVKESAIIPLLILILVSSKVNGLISSRNWGVTQFEELKLHYTWIINNFELVTLQNQGNEIYSPDFWPPGNESFKWFLSMTPQSENDSAYVELYLWHNNPDTVHVNYTLTIGSVTVDTSESFVGVDNWGRNRFIKRDDAFKSCLPNGTLIVNCEIRAISNVVESSGSDFDQCSMGDDSKISDDFLVLLEDEKFSDVTIKLGQNEIRAHKIILAARSPVLASSIMENGAVNNNQNSNFIEIKDVQPKVFRKLLQYIYTDKVDGVDRNMAKDLLAAAIKYDVKGLKARCEEILCSGMNYENAIEILEMADRYYIHKLKLQASKFIAEHALAVIQSTGFKNLEISKPHPVFEIFRMMAYRSVVDHGSGDV